MTTRYEMAVSRRPVSAAVLAIALSLGACEALSGQETSAPEEASTVSAVAADPGWEIVEDYLTRQQEWTKQMIHGAFGGASDDDSSPSVGEEVEELPSRIMVVRVPGDGSASNAEVQERLREAIESREGAGVVRLGDSEAHSESLPPGLVDQVLRAAAKTGRASELPSEPQTSVVPPRRRCRSWSTAGSTRRRSMPRSFSWTMRPGRRGVPSMPPEARRLCLSSRPPMKAGRSCSSGSVARGHWRS